SRGTTHTSSPLASVRRAMSGTGSGLSAAYGGRSRGSSAEGPATAAPQATADTARASSECLKKRSMVVSSVPGRAGGGGLQHGLRLAVDDGAVGAGQVGAGGALHVGGGDGLDPARDAVHHAGVVPHQLQPGQGVGARE